MERGEYLMVKEMGAGVGHRTDVSGFVGNDSEVISTVWESGTVLAASVSIRRSLLARWRAFFSAVAAGMVVEVE